MRHGVVEGEPGIFPDPIARLWRAIGRAASGRRAKQPRPETARASEPAATPGSVGAPAPGCLTCELRVRRDRDEAPPWDQILRTPSWDVVHAYGTAIEGWLVVAARRHVSAIAELTDAEAAELGPLIKRVSLALGRVVACEKTYVAQFAEMEGHHHVHFHVVPRAADLPDDQRGPRVFSQLGVGPEAAVPEARMAELAAELSKWLDSEPVQTDAHQAPPFRSSGSTRSPGSR